MRGVAVVLSSAMVASLLSGCDPSPEVAEGKPLPVCPGTGRAFTAQQLIDILVYREMRNRIQTSCSTQYATLDAFYKRNPECCGIDFNHAAYEEGPIDWRYLGSVGYLIGDAHIEYVCGDNSEHIPDSWSRSDYDITSCGVIGEGSTTNEESPWPLSTVIKRFK